MKPELHRLLALAARHEQTADGWRRKRDRVCASRLIRRHRDKCQKLLAMAARRGGRRAANRRVANEHTDSQGRLTIMPCPTCGHTMSRIADESLRVWHCPRCGTVAVKHFAVPLEEPDVYVPQLVGRCREFQRLHGTNLGEHMAADWHRLGIAEAINTPPHKGD